VRIPPLRRHALPGWCCRTSTRRTTSPAGSRAMEPMRRRRAGSLRAGVAIHDGFHGDNARAWFLTVVRHACFDCYSAIVRPRSCRRRGRHRGVCRSGRPRSEQHAISRAEAEALRRRSRAAPRFSRGADPARTGGAFLQGNRARHRYADRHRVSRLARARALLQRSPLLHAIRDSAAGGGR